MRTLQDIRKGRFFTRREVAEAIGITKVGLWKIESGRTYPRPSTIRALAAFYVLSPEEIAAACPKEAA